MRLLKYSRGMGIGGKKMRIFKEVLQTTTEQEVLIQTELRPLSVVSQKGQVCVYFQHCESVEPSKHKFLILGTGHEYPVDPYWSFLGTVDLYHDGQFMLHIFYRKVVE